MSKFSYDSTNGHMLMDGYYIWTGYSGHGRGRNDPDFETIHDVGPIPRGEYVFGKPIDHPALGPYAIPIHPQPTTNTFGRSGFYLHGDDAEHDASLGCIVKSPKSMRMKIVEGDELTVV